MIRDGGSMAIDFSSVGEHWCLFFGLALNGYKCPKLFNRSIKVEHEVTWEYARSYVNRVREFELNEFEANYLLICEEIVSNEGDYMRPSPWSTPD